MKVRELIEILMDFPLDSDIGIEKGLGDGDYCDIISIDHDSESEYGYTIYDITTIHIATTITEDSNILDWDFRGDWVTDKPLTVYENNDDEDSWNIKSFKIEFNKDTGKFEKIT